MDSNIALGPVYFDYFHDLELDCQDDGSITKALTVNIHIRGLDMDFDSRNIYMTYRIYYKAMTLQDLGPKALKPTTIRDQTMIFQTNFEKSIVQVPRMVS